MYSFILNFCTLKTIVFLYLFVAHILQPFFSAWEKCFVHMKLCFSNIFCILGFVTFVFQQCDRNVAFSLKILDFYLFVYISGACVLVGVRELEELALFHCVSPGVEFEVVWLSHRYFFPVNLPPGSELPPLPSVLIPLQTTHLSQHV